MPCLVEVSLLQAGGTISMSICFIFLIDGSLYVVPDAFKLRMHDFVQDYTGEHQEKYFFRVYHQLKSEYPKRDGSTKEYPLSHAMFG